MSRWDYRPPAIRTVSVLERAHHGQLLRTLAGAAAVALLLSFEEGWWCVWYLDDDQEWSPCSHRARHPLRALADARRKLRDGEADEAGATYQALDALGPDWPPGWEATR